MREKNRVVVAMSGGVDSSVAAALLKRQGYEVIGITMCFSAAGGSAYGGNLPDSRTKKPTCCGTQGIEDARRVTHKLGIRHYVLNMQGILFDKVINDFCQEYSRGRTPNPCVRCNQYIKFDALLKKAISLGAEYLATGHYARIEKRHHDTTTPRYQYLLKKAKDFKKDQSYFLYRLGQNQLKRLLFPLGNYTKEQVRKFAEEFSLAVAKKLESQEICFVPNVDYREFLKKQGIKNKPGYIVDTRGNILGKHQGIAFYTIGQREGLGIAAGYPLHITKINARSNRIVVGKKEEVLKSEFLVKKAHFIYRAIKKKVALKTRIRYNHKEMPAKILRIRNNKVKVHFQRPQFAITPGQSAVFYDKDTVVGGGIIEEVLS